jgi:hypothetical protein
MNKFLMMGAVAFVGAAAWSAEMWLTQEEIIKRTDASRARH